MVPRRKNRTEPPPAECPLTACMRLLGGAWTPNVIWYLQSGPRRFSELKADLHGVSAKTLTVRLRKLEAEGLVHRASRPTSPPTIEYSLTAFGARLIPAIEAIVQVGHELKGLRRRRASA